MFTIRICRYGLLFFKHARVEDGRNVFTRSLKNLETRDAADISAKFAQLEFKYGDQERGEFLYLYDGGGGIKKII